LTETTALEELESEPVEPVIETPENNEAEEKQEGEEKQEKPKENRYSRRVKDLNTKYRQEQREKEALQKRLNEIEEKNKLKKEPEPDDYDDGVVPEEIKKKWDNQTRESIREEERNKLKQEQKAKKQAEKWDEGRKLYIKSRADYVKEDPSFGSYEREIDDAVDQFQAPEIQNMIVESKELGPAIVSHFGKNPDDLLDIASASPQKRFFKMGQLIAKLEAKPVKKSSSAPAPTRSEKGSAKKVVAGRNAPRGKNETFAEYARRKNGL